MVSDSQFRGRERGQLLLIGAVTIALVILGTVVLLNGMKFTDSIGSEGNTESLKDAMGVTEEVKIDLLHLSNRVQETEGLSRNINESLAKNFSIYGNVAGNMTATSSVADINVSLNRSASTTGRFINQTAGSGGYPDFTLNRSTGQQDEWVLATDASVANPFNLTIPKGRFPCNNGNSEQSKFVVEIDSGADSWEVQMLAKSMSGKCDVYESGSGNPSQAKRIVRIPGETPKEFTGTSQVPTKIDLYEGTVEAGPASTDLERSIETTTPPYTVTFKNEYPGGRKDWQVANGTYRFGTDSTEQDAVVAADSSLDNDEFNPNVTAPILVPAATITYNQDTLTYETTILLDGGD